MEQVERRKYNPKVPTGIKKLTKNQESAKKSDLDRGPAIFDMVSYVAVKRLVRTLEQKLEALLLDECWRGYRDGKTRSLHLGNN